MHNNIATEKIRISNTGSGLSDALNLTEHIAGVMGLDTRSRFHARLLSEELFSMVRAITGDFNAEYWLERENNTLIYHLEAKSASVSQDYSKKRALLSASSTGTNTARLGIMERIRELVQAGLYSMSESFNIQAEYGTGLFAYGALGISDSGISDAVYAWSLQKYKHDAVNDELAEDELEKSIIANIADEVKVGINREGIEIVIYKSF